MGDAIIQGTLKDLLNDKFLGLFYRETALTPSKHNQGVTEVDKIKSLVREYINKYPYLASYPVTILPNFPNAFFNSAKNSFGFGLFNAAVIAHEMEHATSLKDSKVYEKILSTSKMITGLSDKVDIPLAAAIAITAHAKGMPMSRARNILNALSLGHGVASMPELYEEGKANLFAVLNAPDKMEALSTLAPAYGTYLTKAILPIGVYQGTKGVSNLIDK
jgi:hypothetical protein